MIFICSEVGNYNKENAIAAHNLVAGNNLLGCGRFLSSPTVR